MARQMTKIELAVRDALRPFVRDELLTWGEADRVVGDIARTEKAVRDNYRPDQASYYAARTDEARGHYAAATSLMGRATRLPRLLICETYAAVYTVVHEEQSNRQSV